MDNSPSPVQAAVNIVSYWDRTFRRPDKSVDLLKMRGSLPENDFRTYIECSRLLRSVAGSTRKADGNHPAVRS